MLEKVVHFILGRWFFAVYFSLGAIYFVVFRLSVCTMTWVKSLFITLGLMTGSDPYSFKDTIEPYLLIWLLAWLIHIASWLLIPALIGLLVSDAAQDIKRERALQKGFNELLIEAGVSQENLPRFEDTLRGKLDEMIKESYRKEKSP